MTKFEIQVFVRGEWKVRGTREADKPNDALRSYGLNGSRPRLGECTSASGKRFRAVPMAKIEPATKRTATPARKRAARGGSRKAA